MASSAKKQIWFVYIVECADKTLYTDITTDVTRRLHEHNNSIKGARYTRQRRPVHIVYKERLDSRAQACCREAEIKKMTRNKKMTLIMYNRASS